MSGQVQPDFIFAALSAFALSFVLTGLAASYARRRGLLDHPGERHSHTVSTPRGGGAGLFAALLLTSLWFAGVEWPGAWLMCIMPGAIVIAVLGAWDDHASLGVALRFFIQLAVSCYLLWCAAVSGWMHGVIPMVAGGFFMVWMTNLYNFMDGSNGLAGLQGVFVGSVLSFLFFLSGDPAFSILSLLMAASCAGFLPWNLGRARVFMGDVGSLTLGFLVAAFMMYGVGTDAFEIPVALLLTSLFLIDSTLTLLSRVIRRERWYTAHRQHLYQRMIAGGWTHGSVAMLYQAINLALVLPGIFVAVRFPALAWVVALASVSVFILGWLLLILRFELPARTG